MLGRQDDGDAAEVAVAEPQHQREDDGPRLAGDDRMKTRRGAQHQEGHAQHATERAQQQAAGGPVARDGGQNLNTHTHTQTQTHTNTVK